MDASLAQRSILIVESNLDRARLIEKAIDEQTGQYQITTISNGLQILDFLHRRGEYMEAPRPDLILLDLDLVGRDGMEVLAEIKADSQLRRIPIVVLTMSDRAEDILQTYKLQGNCYVLESNDSEQLFQIVKRIKDFWLTIVTLPLERSLH